MSLPCAICKKTCNSVAMCADQSAAQPGVFYDLTTAGALPALVGRYGEYRVGAVPRGALAGVVSAAIAAGANAVAVEPNYVDLDWRSELTAFYSKSFCSYPSFTDRLHFLSVDTLTDSKKLADQLSSSSTRYIGYSVMRPLKWAPVGRTMLAPPKTLKDRVQCVATDVVHLNGITFPVTGAPFISQDSQLTRCAHAVAWQVAYLHHLRFGSNRTTSSSMVESAALDVSEARHIPSTGLMRSQLGRVLRRAGIGPVVYNTASLPGDGETVGSLLSRYVSAGFPVIAANDRHSVLVIGQYGKTGAHEYVFHDDERGPYIDTSTSSVDAARPWTRLVVPVQPKLYVPGEQAEAVAHWMLTSVAPLPDSSQTLRSLARRFKDSGKQGRLRTFPMESIRYKELLGRRGLPDDLVAAVRTKPMPRWVWITEVTARGELISELVIDATSAPRARWVLSWLLDEEYFYFNPFTTETELLPVCPPGLARTALLSVVAKAGVSSE